MAAKGDYDPSKFAAPKLWFHIAQKGWQAGSTIGTVAVGPGMVLYDVLKNSNKADPLKLTEGAAYGVLGGLALTGVLGALKTLQMDREGLEDRVYRLHYNLGQKRTDEFAGVGGLLGLAAGAYLLPKYTKAEDIKPLNYLGCAAVGSLLGILAHVATRPNDRTPNKMLHELRY